MLEGLAAETRIAAVTGAPGDPAKGREQAAAHTPVPAAPGRRARAVPRGTGGLVAVEPLTGGRVWGRAPPGLPASLPPPRVSSLPPPPPSGPSRSPRGEARAAPAHQSDITASRSDVTGA